MTKQPHSASRLPTKVFKVSSSESPPLAEGHADWLLDEALAETFPASDSISPYRRVKPLRTSPPGMPGEVEMTHKISDCNIGHRKDLEPKALETPIECERCHTEIPATVALSFEGADYIYHFCGPQCLEAWCKATNAHDK